MIFRRRAKAPKVVRHKPKCNFCGNEQAEKRGVRLIAGPGVYICSECISLANEILRGGGNRPAPASS